MKYLTALLTVFLAGCTAIKHKQHTLFCVGACIHHEGDTQKEGAGPPKKPGPSTKQVTPVAELPADSPVGPVSAPER